MQGKLSTLVLMVLLGALIFGGVGATAVHAQSEDTYVVQPGDTMLSIAARHGISVSQLAWANGLRWNSWVYVGQRLIIPGSSSPLVGSGIYVVQRGDTLSAIAVRYNTTLYQLAQMNGLANPDLIYVGQRLVVPDAPVYDPDIDTVVYTVQAGDTLIGIATRFHVGMWDIVLANNIAKPSLIYVGQRLLIPGRDSIPGSPAVTISPTSGPSGTQVEVVASGFPANTPVSVGLGPPNSEFSEVARGTTDANGRFIVRVAVQGAAGMSWMFGVSGGGAHATAAPFHITASNPTVTISPTNGPSGTLVQVVASGFPAHTPVTVWVGPENSEFSEVAHGTTDGNGVFTVQVPVHGGAGMTLVFAVSADDQTGAVAPDRFYITN
jgi:LysM repeat protein